VSSSPGGTIFGGSGLPSWERGSLLLFHKDGGVTFFSSFEASHGQRGQSEACMGCPVSSVKQKPPYVSLSLMARQETRRPQCQCCLSPTCYMTLSSSVLSACLSYFGNTFGAQTSFFAHSPSSPRVKNSHTKPSDSPMLSMAVDNEVWIRDISCLWVSRTCWFPGFGPLFPTCPWKPQSSHLLPPGTLKDPRRITDSCPGRYC